MRNCGLRIPLGKVPYYRRIESKPTDRITHLTPTPNYDSIANIVSRYGYNSKVIFLTFNRGINVNPASPQHGTISFAYIFYDGEEKMKTFDPKSVKGQSDVCAITSTNQLFLVGFSWYFITQTIMETSCFHTTKYILLFIDIGNENELIPLEPVQADEIDLGERYYELLRIDNNCIILELKQEFEIVYAYIFLMNGNIKHQYRFKMSKFDADELGLLGHSIRSLQARFWKNDRCYLIL